jgi:hypothetical protein
MANRQLSRAPRTKQLWVSDHKILEWELPTTEKKCPRRRHAPTPSWKKPPGVAKADWREVLATATRRLQDEGGTRKMEEALQKDAVDCDAELAHFNQVLNGIFRDAYDSILGRESETENGNTTKGAVLRSLDAKGSKGGAAKLISAGTGSGISATDTSMKQRKTRKWLARAHTLIRTLEAEQSPGAKLIKRVQKRLDKQVEDEIGTLEAAKIAINLETAKMFREEDAQRTKRIANWRERMKGGIEEVAGWLRSKLDAAVPTIVKNGEVAATREEACEHIAQHWRSVGGDPPTEEEIAQRAARIVAHIDRPYVKWKRPDLDTFEEAFRNAKGSCGPDGWTADELCHLPRIVIHWFSQLTARWEKARKVPKAMGQARQVNLSKPKKVKAGRLEAKDARPITVLNVLWRTYMSAWLNCASWREWNHEAFPRDGPVCGGKGSAGAEEVASELYGAFAKDGYFATMDFSQCFDRVHAGVSCEVLSGLGFPIGLTSVLADVWTRQERFLAWDGHTSATPLHASCLPQGDPASPFVLGLWMLAGNKEIARGLSKKPGRTTKTYMDDRSWTDRDPERLVEACVAWERWSGEMGLLENADKTQLGGWEAKHREKLKEAAQKHGLEDKVVEVVEALGVCTGAKSTEKEKKRLGEATKAARLLAVIPGGRTKKNGLCRSLSLSKAVYGWNCKRPAQKDTKELESAVNSTTRMSKATNKWLKQTLEGGTLNARVVVAQRQISLAIRRKQAGNLRSDDPLLKATSRSLNQWGWKAKGSGAWELEGGDNVIDLSLLAEKTPKLGRGEANHAIRESYRRHCWQKFRGGKRRAACILKEVPYDERQGKLARDLYEDEVMRCVMTGGFLSPACMQNKEGAKQLDTSCPWCEVALGHTEHIFWECKERPSKVPRPANNLQARLGWPDPAKSWKVNAETTDWMKATVQEVWEKRYGARSQPATHEAGQSASEDSSSDEDSQSETEKTDAEEEDDGPTRKTRTKRQRPAGSEEEKEEEKKPGKRARQDEGLSQGWSNPACLTASSADCSSMPKEEKKKRRESRPEEEGQKKRRKKGPEDEGQRKIRKDA